MNVDVTFEGDNTVLMQQVRQGTWGLRGKPQLYICSDPAIISDSTKRYIDLI